MFSDGSKKLNRGITLKFLFAKSIFLIDFDFHAFLASLIDSYIPTYSKDLTSVKSSLPIFLDNLQKLDKGVVFLSFI